MSSLIIPLHYSTAKRLLSSVFGICAPEKRKTAALKGGRPRGYGGRRPGREAASGIRISNRARSLPGLGKHVAGPGKAGGVAAVAPQGVEAPVGKLGGHVLGMIVLTPLLFPKGVEGIQTVGAVG